MAHQQTPRQSGANAEPASARASTDGGAASRLTAGVAVAVVVALAVAWLRPMSPSPTTAPVAASASEPAALLPPDVWREAFPLEPAAVHLTAAELEATPSMPGVTALTQALGPYRAGDYQAAAVALDGVLVDHPDEYRAALYLGVSRLFIDEPQAAIESFRVAEQSTDAAVLADAAWFTLVGIARLREPAQAETDARALCERGGQGSERACRAVDALARARRSR